MGHSQKNKPPQKKSKTYSTISSLSEAYRNLAPYLNIGYVFAASIILLTFFGYYLDNKWGTKPWFTLGGAIVGIIAGFYNFFKTVFRANKNKDKDGE